MRLPAFPRSLASIALLVVPSLVVPRLAAQSTSPNVQKAMRAPPYVAVEGSLRKWQHVSLTLHASERLDERAHPAGRNPFLDHRLTGTFTHVASGTQYVVPGYFAADGAAADSSATLGECWRIDFTPDHAGLWTWSIAFRRGPGIALDAAQVGTPADPELDGASGKLHVKPADPLAPGFLRAGRLEYVGEHYFRFGETLEPFLKNGAGGPENFLAYFELDGTTGNPVSSCLTAPAHPEHLHRYEAHAADFVGDEIDLAHTWGSPPRGQNLLGALDYLASVGVNSFYFITDSYKGDGNDVWPWVSPTDKTHFDVSKLAQWERIFAHMTERGIQLQIVLEETENDQLPVANGGMGYGLTSLRRLYYREMVARFAHNPAIHWVIGDESNYYDDVPTMETLATEIRALDPYDHPLAFHGQHPCTSPGCDPVHPTVYAQFSPYFGFDAFEASAFQTAPGGYNSSTIQLRAGQTNSRKWAHFGDEQSLNATPSNLEENRKKALWGNLMGGGAGVAWYPGNDVSGQYEPGEALCDYFDVAIDDLHLLEGYFLQTSHALAIFAQLPFTEMQAENTLASPSSAQDYVFRRAEDQNLGIRAVYAVYRATGSETTLTLGPGVHTVEWFDPRDGTGPIAAPDLTGPGAVPLPPPAQDPGQDWVAIVRQQ